MKRCISYLTKTFLAGLAVGIPLIFTVWVIVQLGRWLNGLAVRGTSLISQRAGDTIANWPGVGLVMIIITIFVVITLIGAAARFWFTAGIFSKLEHLLERLPLVKTIYTSVRDMLRFFGGGGSRGRVVLYRPGNSQVRMLAIVTNERPVGLSGGAAAGMLAIWLPMSYNLGGYMLYVPADSVEPIDMSVEEVLKLTATAELGAGKLLAGGTGFHAGGTGLQPVAEPPTA